MKLTKSQKELFEKTYDTALEKFNLHMQSLNGMPFELTACTNGMYYNGENGCELTNINNWMTSFVTGLAPLYYRHTKNHKYIDWAQQFQRYYHSKVFDTPLESMHDMGFLYSLYSIAMYKITNDISHKTDALKAADELAKRLNLNGRFIEAWERMDTEKESARAIIDSMMNLALMLWAWKETGHLFYRDVCEAHAQTVKRVFIRDDNTVAHSFLFDRQTGAVIEESNTCGFSNGSWWARGTAWAVYGFAILGEYTHKKEYTDISLRLADAYINQIGGGSKIPLWDFRLSKELPAKKCGPIPSDWDETDPLNTHLVTDTSATAIMACAFLRLGNEKLKAFAIESIEELCLKYVNYNVLAPGILHHQNGNMSYTTYGDYFIMEAICALLHGEKSFW